jgi:hypothetical protein
MASGLPEPPRHDQMLPGKLPVIPFSVHFASNQWSVLCRQ